MITLKIFVLVYSSGSQTGGKLPVSGNVRFSGGNAEPKTQCCSIAGVENLRPAWTFDMAHSSQNVSTSGAVLRSVDKFCHLGSTVYNTSSMKSERDVRKDKAATMFGQLRSRDWSNGQSLHPS